MKSYSVAIIDDMEFDRLSMSRILARGGFQIEEYSSAPEFLNKADFSTTHCIIVDYNMPGMDGIAFQRKLRESEHRIPIILVSGVATVPTAVEALRLGASDMFEKPVDAEAFLQAVNKALAFSERLIHRRELADEIRRELEKLTPREREVLPFVCNGYSLKEISTQFGFGFATAARHQSRILAKLHSDSTLQLVQKLQVADIRID
jgi:two-component system, LuxR family, response regulator FixJ